MSSIEHPIFRDFAVYLFTAWQPSLRAALKSLLGHQALKAVERHADVDLAAPPSSILPAQWITLYQRVRYAAMPRIWLTITGSEQRLKHQQASLQKRHRTRRACATIIAS